MPDSKITALTSIGTGTDPANDPLVIVDVSDVSPGGMSATGTTKKVTLNNLLACSPTATLASATITGDLTVDTNVLKVDTLNNRVGIGTASPTVALDVVGASAISGTVSVGTTTPLATGSGRGNVTVNGSTDAILAFGIAGVNSGFVLQDSAGMTLLSSGATYLRCYTNGSERYKIDSTGVATWSNVGGVAGTAMTLNSTGLGVGVSPSYKLDVSSSSNIVGRVSSSSVLNTGFNIVNTTGSTWSLYSFGSNDATLQNSFGIYHQNGTSFLQITQAGNVGVGVTPSAWGSTYKGIQFTGGAAISYGTGTMAMMQNAYDSGAGSFRYVATAASSFYQQTSGEHQWSNASSGTAGNLINGGTGAWTRLMTLDASGNLLVGTTSLGARSTNIFSKSGGFALEVEQRASGSAGSGLGITYSAASPNNATDYFLYCADSTTVRLYANSNGNLLNSNGSYGTISDLRLKENISDARNYLADLLKLRVVKYSLKSEASAVATKIGLIAQEVEQVFPTLVETNSDEVKSIKTTVLIPMLLKAIQELTARVEALEA